MALSLSDIDAELAKRQTAGNPAIDEIDAELAKRGVQSSSMGDVAAEAVKTALTQGPIQTPLNLIDPENTKKMNEVLGIPMRGIRGALTAPISGIQRGAEAVKPDFKPKGVGENVANFAAEMADPRGMAFNEPLGAAITGATKAASVPLGFLGKQAARGLQLGTGVPAEDIIATAKNPLGVLFSKLSKNSGKAFQEAKEGVVNFAGGPSTPVTRGVTEAEERLTAGIGDPSGWKRVADQMAEKLKATGDLTVGEALAWKKSAGELARKAKGSARFIYTQDAKKAESILAEKAPKVLESQKDVHLSKLRESFMSLLPRNKSSSTNPAVLRGGAAGAMIAAGHPEIALAMSPLLSAFPLTVGAGLTSKAVKKGLNVIAENPAARQVLLGVLQRIQQGTQNAKQ